MVAMDDHVARILESDESIELVANARTHRVVVTDRRLAVADDERVALQVPYPGLRRIQFDIERDRPATLVIVPQSPNDEPQVLAIRPEDYEGIALALVTIGRRIAT
jgi:hypothetical protein